MPRHSQRSRALQMLFKECKNRQFLRLLRTMNDNHSSFPEDFIDLLYVTYYLRLKQQRYITRGPYRTGLSLNIFQTDVYEGCVDSGHLPFLNDVEFLQKYRLSRTSFSKLVTLIQDHPVFAPPSAGPNQQPVAHQLMTFSKYLGTDGAGNSNAQLRSIFRTGRGTNNLFKTKVSTAI